METSYEISYRPEVLSHDLPLIGEAWQRAILVAIEEKLVTRPDVYGKPLRQNLKGYRKLRVGDYRVVFIIHAKEVRIIAIVHRSSEYKTVEKRK